MTRSFTCVVEGFKEVIWYFLTAWLIFDIDCILFTDYNGKYQFCSVWKPIWCFSCPTHLNILKSSIIPNKKSNRTSLCWFHREIFYRASRTQCNFHTTNNRFLRREISYLCTMNCQILDKILVIIELNAKFSKKIL